VGGARGDVTIGIVRAIRVAVLVAAALLSLPATLTVAQPLAPGSLSCGAANRGALAGARAIPDRGHGFVTPEPWRARGLRYGTDELVGVIERAAAAVARQYAGAVLAVADLSAQQGGAVPRHASHQSGRDADLIYYAIDRAGDPFHPDQHMAEYGSDGRAVRAAAPVPTSQIDERYFDLQRNWALVAALVSDTEVQVQRIFVSSRVRSWLLAYARVSAVPQDLLDRVQDVLYTARDASSHQDHMHIRIGCSADDVAQGRCSDASAPRPRARRRRGRRGKRQKAPARWYARVQCVDPRNVATADTPAPPATSADTSIPATDAVTSPSRTASTAPADDDEASEPARKQGSARESVRSARSRGSMRPRQSHKRRVRGRPAAGR
jgi:penicillin-insensitive murein DD-endopeptidase